MRADGRRQPSPSLRIRFCFTPRCPHVCTCCLKNALTLALHQGIAGVASPPAKACGVTWTNTSHRTLTQAGRQDKYRQTTAYERGTEALAGRGVALRRREGEVQAHQHEAGLQLEVRGGEGDAGDGGEGDARSQGVVDLGHDNVRQRELH